MTTRVEVTITDMQGPRLDVVQTRVFVMPEDGTPPYERVRSLWEQMRTVGEELSPATKDPVVLTADGSVSTEQIQDALQTPRGRMYGVLVVPAEQEAHA